MKLKIVLGFFVLFNLRGVTQTFWTETFTNGCTSGCETYTGPNGAWLVTNTGVNDVAANTWFISCAENGNAAGLCGTACAGDASLHVANVSTSPGAGMFCPTGDCGAAYDAGDLSNSVRTSKRAESPIINCSGFSNIGLTFNYIENGQATLDDATLWYFDGTTWSQLSNLAKTSTSCGGTGLWTAFSVFLPTSANNNPNVKIGFNWINNDDNVGGDPSFAVDDIELSNCFGGMTDLVGHVVTSLSANVDNGLVYAFRHQPGTAGLDTIDVVSLDANGNYNFLNLINDNYLVKVIADTTNFPLAIPTYYGNVFQWDSSIVVTHGCLQNDTADIQVIEVTPAIGPGLISGFLIEQSGFGSGRLGPNVGNPNQPFVPGGPLKGIDVKLGRNPGGGIQARTTTDTTGYYQFNNLPLQGYKVYVDIPNLPMDSTREIILTSGSEVSIENNYFADSASVYVNSNTVGIYVSIKSYENSFSVFPNPTKNRVNISFDTKSDTEVMIEIYNAVGQVLKSEKIKNNNEKFSYTLNIADMKLNSGVYFISLINGNQKCTQRIVVIE